MLWQLLANKVRKMFINRHITSKNIVSMQSLQRDTSRQSSQL